MVRPEEGCLSVCLSACLIQQEQKRPITVACSVGILKESSGGLRCEGKGMCGEDLLSAMRERQKVVGETWREGGGGGAWLV